MTETAQENQVQAQTSDKELNFRRLESKYQQELAQERGRVQEMERRINELSNRQQEEPEEEVNEPYVDHKRLDKKLNTHAKNTQTEISKAMQYAKEAAKEELKQEMFLESHPDFFQTLDLAEKFYEKSPKLADNILRMPEGFERQKLVYHTIKELGLDKPEQPKQTIQDTIDAKRKAPYYQPSAVGASPYHSKANFSADGQKQAYDKMKELQSRLRL